MAAEAPDILSAEFSQDPFPVLEVMRDDYPVMYHEITNSYVISRYEDVGIAFRDPRFNYEHYV